MKTVYTAYAKTIHGTLFYFVKKFQTFPGLQNVPPVLESFAMHTNFVQACRIAQVYDKVIQQRLLHDLEANTASSRVLPLYPSVAEMYSLERKQTFFPSLLKLIGLS